ncbi:MAG TPA: VanW family protein [Acidimicrobiales bacterium]|nr:VanW family protein [Acidimicrobiales bacterium]
MRRRLLLIAAVPVALVVVLVAAWLLIGDARVSLAGRDVSGADDPEVRAVVERIVEDRDDVAITIDTPDGTLETTGSDVGLTVDVDATVEAALDAGETDPLQWAVSLLSPRNADLVVTVDDALVGSLVREEDPTERVEPIEPGIAGDEGQIAVVLGEDGRGLDAGDVAEAIESAAASGDDVIDVIVEPTTLRPRFGRADAEALAEEARSLTAEPLTVTVGDVEVDIPGSVVRSWLASEDGGDSLELSLSDEEVLASLAELVPVSGREPEDARFSVEGGVPVIIGGVPGETCCGEASVGYLLGAVRAGHGGPVDLPLREVEPEQSTDELESLGIVEEIGAFTTNHACCESRVTNIHRISDLVRGVVIEPGETFSINDHVGRRTTENGFAEGGVIQNGVFETSIGGGISQFATTLFNAAFFGGLEFDEYQSHSIHIARYPYGREATLSYPKPDLIISNPTPHGVLIWPSYDDTSITVRLYSTRWARGEQTAQTEAPVGEGPCKRVRTERTRTFADGRPPETDAVFAVYRPAEGVQC